MLNQAGALYQPPQQQHGEHQPMLTPSQPLKQGIATTNRSEDLVHTDHVLLRPILALQSVLKGKLLRLPVLVCTVMCECIGISLVGA